MKFLSSGSVALILLCLPPSLGAGENTADSKPLPETWSEAKLAIKQFQLPDQFKMDVFAVEPQLSNPVAFHVDEQGRVFVSETHRYRTSALDIRHYMGWYLDDLAARTVEDRIRVIRKHMGRDSKKLAVESEIVRLVEDTDGDGRADQSKVFASGFDTLLDGIASGVLARNGDVYFANIPNLWLLKDKNNDGKADVRKSLSYGYGVHFSLTGHDLHGLIFGPDGKLYFTVGDRGANVKTKEGKQLAFPDMGVAFRCNPDGSQLEAFAIGLRNPQELAFDEYGNLFTGDNNCDHGDSARWVHVVEGGDSGWRVGYQFSEQNPAGLWNAEKLWHLQFPGQAAYIIPPAGHIASGPSGLAYYPGTGLPQSFNRHFFLCDFRGAANGSGVHTFTVEPEGAGFKLQKPERFLWEILLTDFDFGPDGYMYMTDWVHGWPKSDKGRIYRLFHPDTLEEPIVRETQELLRSGMDQRSDSQLAELLSHPDMRVRQSAQFALAGRGRSAGSTFGQLAISNARQLARIHAIWGMGQLLAQGTKAPNLVSALQKVASDTDPEIRAQTARVLADNRVAQAYPQLVHLLSDSSPRVQFFAALGLGKIGRPEAAGPLFDMIQANDGKDVYLRHAGVMALAWIADQQVLKDAAQHPSSAVRMAALLAMRRLEKPDVAQFLNDSDPLLVVEAARAINDVPIEPALRALATLASHSDKISALLSQSDPALGLDRALWRRVINAAFRLGTPKDAITLGTLAANNEVPEPVRAEAIQMLGEWKTPGPRDKVTGLWQPLSPRNAVSARIALQPHLTALLSSAPEPVRSAAAEAAAALKFKAATDSLFELVSDPEASGALRATALRALAELDFANLAGAIEIAQSSFDPDLRKQATLLQATVEPSAAIDELVKMLESGSIPEQQAALGAVSTIAGSVADEIILQWLDKVAEGTIAQELELDVLEAASSRKDQRIHDQIDDLAVLYQDHPVGELRPLLHGGDPLLGEQVFFQRPEAACVRCHKVNGNGGDVGPDLTHIGTQSREHILESIVHPNKVIAPGFETVIVRLKDGTVHAGIVKEQTAEKLVLNSPEDGLIEINANDIESRQTGLSGMPEGVDLLLSKSDIRNLVAYLAGLK